MNSWDSEKLWLKAKIFIDKANDYDQSSADFAFYSALALECLTRSALTFVHPALNADPREDVNLLYGFGYRLTSKPRSLPAHSVHLRLEKLIETFGRPQRELCDFVALMRNAHLHSADLPYENLVPAKWLPRYYETAKVLNEFMNRTLTDYLGREVAASATELVKSLNEEVAAAVKKKIAAHKQVFEAKAKADQKILIEAARVASSTLRLGEVARSCPACASPGTLFGIRVKEFPEKYENGELLMDVQYLATGFTCIVCDLALKGVEEVAHAELDTHFVETTSTSLHELYEPEFYEEYDNM